MPLDIVVCVEEAKRAVLGFQFAVKAAGTTGDYHDHAGRLELIDSTITQLVADHYVTHRAGGAAQQEWSVHWVPPEGETRDVTVMLPVTLPMATDQIAGITSIPRVAQCTRQLERQ